MRKLLLITLAAATAISSPALARPHHGHYDRDRHHESHHRDRHHYDRHHSRHHRYHAYVAPYRGWHHQRIRVGFRLRPAFYGPRYIVTNYGYYGLRAPGRHLRWIRYGNDLLLVDIRYGRVIEVLPGRYYY